MKRISFLFFVFAAFILNLDAQSHRSTTLKNLVCFVRFSDEENTVFEKNADDYQLLFNANGSTDVSVYNYFRQASYNQLSWTSSFYPTATGTQVVSFQASHTRNYYIHSSSINAEGYNVDNTADALLREQNLVKEIADYLNTIVPQEATIDGNNDGVIDNICIILSGNSEINSKYLLWPHRSTLYLKNATIAGKTVNEYILLFDGANGWNSLSPVAINAGVLCHEMSHTLGTRDLYHTQKGLNPVGVWDLMSDNLLTPQGMSAYTKFKYCKWIDTIPEITTPGVYTLNAVGGVVKENLAYKIKLPESDQFFVLEYRKRTPPFESGLPASGLLIYRINPNFVGNEGYNGTTKFDEQYLFRPGGTPTADGTITQAVFSQESGRTAFGGTADLKPFYQDGTEASFAIANVGSCGETISFELLPFLPKIILSQKEVSMSGDASATARIQLKAVNTSWEIRNLPTWLAVSATSGMMGTTDLTFTTVSRNDQLIARTATVLLQSTTDNNLSVELKVNQFSAVIQSPYKLEGRRDGNNVSLIWKKPIEGSAVYIEGFENTETRPDWIIQSSNNVGWTWQEKAKNKLPFEGNFSIRLNTETMDRHQDERIISPKFASGGRLFFQSNSIAPLKINTHNFYYVEVSSDNGQNWTKVFDLKTQGAVVNKFERIEVDLSAYVSNDMRIAFHAYDDNNLGLSYWWHVDNVEIYPYVSNSMVREYHIYRNGEKIGISTDCSFVDPTPLTTVNIYKVKAIGDFGETVFSNEYSLDLSTSLQNKLADDIQIKVSNVYVQVVSSSPMDGLVLFDTKGCLVYQSHQKDMSYRIPASILRKGVYIIQVLNEKRQRVNYKLIF